MAMGREVGKYIVKAVFAVLVISAIWGGSDAWKGAITALCALSIFATFTGGDDGG